MNVSLTRKLDQFVRRKVASGLYTSASEVVREALRQLEERDRIRQQQLAELRKEIARGLEQLDRGESRPLNRRLLEEIKERGRKRLTQRRKPA